ncbi:DUF4083 family protein [Neobacillus vireti]|uniref:DUF4083 family protein n=1 Tax=Neobacillus vireti TaxID=220686 RepID=UPI002FFD9808
MSLNIADIIFQLFTFLVPIIFISLIVLFVRSTKQRNVQLKRMEEKLDKISEQNRKR